MISQKNWILWILLSLILTVNGNVDEHAIKCPLVWIGLSFGDELPKNSVSTAAHVTVNYVARSRNSNENFSGGRWESGLVHIVANGNTVETYESNYEILTNPHGCMVDWQEKGYTGANRVLVGSGNTFIGRAVVGNVLFSGEVLSNNLYLVGERKEKVTTSNFQVLRSFSKGLVLKMTNFRFLGDDPFPPTKDFVGLDEIINNGDSNLVQTVKFTKRVLEKSTTYSAYSQQHTISIGLSVKAEVKGLEPELELGIDVPWGKSDNREISHEVETTLEVTREVIVPPYTAVQVCSTVNMADNFNVQYSAKGVYSAPGLTHQEILEVLRLDGKTGNLDEQNNTYVEETGRFAGSLPLTNQFIIVPYDSPEGCAQLAKKIANVKTHLKSQNYSPKLAYFYFQEIENMIVRMTKPNSKKIK